jgi:hypothetical protein
MAISMIGGNSMIERNDASLEMIVGLEMATFHQELESPAEGLYEELRKEKGRAFT